MSYADFEGVIPKGEYGGGSVMLWDRGTWAPIEGKSAKDIEKGHLHFILDGERMKGEWMLVRMKPRGNERSEEHTSELQSLMRISYAVFCLKQKKPKSLSIPHHPTYHITIYIYHHIST